MTKICSKCKASKAMVDFYKKTALRLHDDGYDYYCKSCRNTSCYKTWTTNKIKCTEDGCNNPNYAQKLCKNHYHKLLRRNKKDKK